MQLFFENSLRATETMWGKVKIEVMGANIFPYYVITSREMSKFENMEW